MSVSIEAFKDSIVNPLKKTIENYRSVTLSQFRSREDVTKQWDVSIGMESVLNYIEKSYADIMSNPPTSDTPKSEQPTIEIVDPKK